MQRLRVILAAHGEAESAGFLENFRVGWRTLGHASEVMNLPAPLRFIICVMGSLRKRLAGGLGSVHKHQTREQAKALQLVLNEDPETIYTVEAAFASAPMYIKDAISRPGNVDRQLVLSMIPTDSRLSCGVICHALLEGTKLEDSNDKTVPTSILARLWDAPQLIHIHCAHVAKHVQATSADQSNVLILVLHGTLVQNAQGMKPDFHTGVDEKATYAGALRKALLAKPDRAWARVEIAYLNHGVGGQWSSPALPERLAQLESEGVNSVTVYACEHLVDGGETQQLSQMLSESAIQETHQLPCLNSSEPFIEFLANRIRHSAVEPTSKLLCDQCPLAR